MNETKTLSKPRTLDAVFSIGGRQTLRTEPVAQKSAKCAYCALVVATPQCEVEFANPAARRWLKNFFPRPERARLLPRKVCRWLAGQGVATGRNSLIVRREKERLFVRRFQPHPENSIALLLEMVSEKKGRVRRRYGALTRRESEVLLWVANGKSNPEIAEILDLAVGTVRKHVQRVLHKMGVENRTAAASFVWVAGAAGAPSAISV